MARPKRLASSLPTFRVFFTEIPVFRTRTQSVGRYSYSAGLALLENEYEYHFIEYEYEGSRKDVDKDEVIAMGVGSVATGAIRRMRSVRF